MVDTVVVNDQQVEENPSLEEQSAQQDKEQNQAEQTSGDRPEWLPEKFANAEELAKAYGELEKKNSTPKEETTTKSELEINKSEAEQSTGLSLDSYYEEFAENGNLGEESYTKLEKAGLSRDLVDSYIQGQQAIGDTQTREMHQIVGGEENYTNVVQWASENLSENEITAYNNALNGDIATAKLGLQGIYAKYQSQNNTSNEPSLTQGKTISGRTDVFNSTAEIVSAINDKRYEVDTAYRKTIEEKVKRSNVL